MGRIIVLKSFADQVIVYNRQEVGFKLKCGLILKEVTRMNNTMPYGYTIKNGAIIADELRSNQVQDFFRLYLDGLGLKRAGKQSGINKQHSVMKHILMNEIYLGTEIYPQIIDDDTFHQAHLEQEKRGKHLRKPQKAKPVERKNTYPV